MRNKKQETGKASYLNVKSVNSEQLILEKVPLLMLSVASCVITVVAAHKGGALKPVMQIPIWLRIENSVVAYVGYISKALWPVDLAVIYPYSTTPSFIKFLLSASLLFAMTYLVWRYRNHGYFFV